MTSISLMVATSAASFAMLYWLFARHLAGRPLLAYQPRKSVPWGAGTAGIALFFTLSAVFGSLISHVAAPGDEPTAPAAQQSDESVVDTAEQPLEHNAEPLDEETDETEGASPVVNGAVTIVFVLGITWLAFNWLRLGCHADALDLGLPLTQNQLLEDIRIGAAACLAAFLPIYVVQVSLTFLLMPEVEHPLIEQLRETSSPAMFVISVLLAVVAAPLSEEVFFRLILQGWLEKWEDRVIGLQIVDRADSRLAEGPSVDSLDDPAVATTPDAIVSSSAELQQALWLLGERPNYGALRQLPHGWLPILLSGILFGLAHLGHGVAPVALVLFGVVLGYVYQRTHRIVPTITAHALFNGYSMLMLWLQSP